MASRRPIDPDATMAEACRVILLDQARRLARAWAPARAGDKRAVHAMRVAARRLRTAIGVARDHLRRRSRRRLDRFDDLLSGLNGRLAPARDFDVLLDRLEDQVEARGDRDHADPAVAVLRRERGEARGRLRRCLDRLRAGCAEAERDLRRPRALEPRGGPAKRVRDALPGEVWRAYGDVRRHTAARRATPEETHALRRDLRRLRFLLEFFVPVLAASTPRLVADLVEAQDELGELNDAAVAVSILGRNVEGVAGARLRALHRGARRDLGRLGAGGERVRATLAGPAFRRRLAAALRDL